MTEFGFDKRSHGKMVNQKDFEKRIVKFVVDTMSPMQLVDHPSFRAIFDNFNVNLFSRRTLTRRISEMSQERKSKLKMELQNVQYVCTTTNIWSGKRKSFFGVTCHWIADCLHRYSVALACRRFTGIHSFDRIANFIEDMHITYGIDNHKVVANFVKEFKEFGIQLPMEVWNQDALQLAEEEQEEEADTSVVMDDEDMEELRVGPGFEEINIEEIEQAQYALPPHLRCASHTINLIFTTDCCKAINVNLNLRTRHTHAMTKCHTLSYPGLTRWNSYYDAINKILKSKEKLPTLFQKLELKKSFSENELLYLEEYCTVIEPMGATLDVLQAENNVLYGTIIPCLASLKNKLKKMKKTNKLRFSLPLLDACLNGLLQRFNLFFKLDEKVTDAIIATVVHPEFKLRWFNIIKKTCSPDINVNNLRKRVVDAAYTFVEMEEVQDQVNTEKDRLFDFTEDENEISAGAAAGPAASTVVAPTAGNVSSVNVNVNKQNNSMIFNNKVELEYLRYMNDSRNTIAMLNDYPTLKKKMSSRKIALSEKELREIAETRNFLESDDNLDTSDEDEVEELSDILLPEEIDDAVGGHAEEDFDIDNMPILFFNDLQENQLENAGAIMTENENEENVIKQIQTDEIMRIEDENMQENNTDKRTNTTLKKCITRKRKQVENTEEIAAKKIQEKSSIDDVDIIQIQDIITKSDSIFSDFNTVQNGIENFTWDENIENEYLERNTFLDTFYSIVALAKKVVADHEKQRDSQQPQLQGDQSNNELDNTTMLPTDNPKHDRLHKLRPIIDLLLKIFQTIPYESCLSVDEHLCSTKARSDLKQYLPAKPHKWGYKLFVLSEVSGFLYNFKIYTGQENNDERRLDEEINLGASANVVVRLLRNILQQENQENVSPSTSTVTSMSTAAPSNIIQIDDQQINELNVQKFIIIPPQHREASARSLEELLVPIEFPNFDLHTTVN
ncbi:hypothetical protein NQ314_008040 [Rhamnusium bicolor]|uniref:PiggyBac transposable element-derived protein domain-containing protein n=1 Tax=Rhamnusium bicolor TaxID=1586634 RepID=A0AAV8YGL0_9CUCU|nr:hypothetical protein NQ314_008040 [Rhamnusium bicolor]